MANNEGLVLDPNATVGAALDLNPSTLGVYGLEAFDPGIAPKRPEWVTGGDVDGGALIRDPLHDPAQGTAQVRIWPAADGDMDGAMAAVGTLLLKMQECSKLDDGLPVLWTPAKAATGRTMYWQLCEFDGAPPIDPTGDLAGWFVQKPVVKLKFTRKPYLYAPELGTVTDNFASNTLANYTFDGGVSGNVSIASGTLNSAANPTVEERLVWTSGTPYTDFYDAQLTVKATLGTTLSGFKAGVVVKRIDANNYVEVYITDNGTTSTLKIDKVVGGSRTNLQSTTLTRLTISTAYWVRGRIEGNTIYAEHWTAAPTNTGTAANAPAGYAVTAGAEQTAFGQGVAGKRGLVWTPMHAAATLDDFTLEPNVWIGTLPIVTGTLPGVAGDVAAEARLIVTERSNQSRRFVEWGLEWRYLNLALGLLIDSEDLVTTGFAGAQTTRTGAYRRAGAANDVVRATLTTQPTAVCGTGNQSHVGTYRVRARCWIGATGVRARLSWQENGGAFRANDYATPPVANTFCDLDLGLISIPAAPSGGTQQWSGRVEAYSSTVGDAIEVDEIVLVPVEGYGKARGAYSYTPGSIVGRDDITGLANAAALNARTAPVGGSWATSGVATDFVGGAPSPTTRGQSVTRSTGGAEASPRFAILGATTYSDIEVGIAVWTSGAFSGNPEHRVVARWVDANNYAYVGLRWDGFNYNLDLRKVVGGTDTQIKSALVPGSGPSFLSVWFQLRAVFYAGGTAIAQVLDTNGALIAQVTGSDSALATGGTLATGKPGFADQNNGLSPTRYFDDFYAATPAAEPVSLYGGRTLEIRFDSTLRQDSTGTFMAQPPAYRGSRFLVPPAGAASRTSRILVKGGRNDVETAEDVPLADTLQVQPAITPRYLAVPR